MALMICKECGAKVSKHADACPTCGNPARRKPRQYGCGTLIIGIVIVVALSSIGRNSKAPSPPLTPKEQRAKDIASQFSGWNGAHRGLEKTVKASLKDPGSYEHIETRYGDKGDHLNVLMKYRAKNGFGGYVVNSLVATCSLAGECKIVYQP